VIIGWGRNKKEMKLLKRLFIIILVFVFIQTNQILAKDWIITPRKGIGPVKIGMHFKKIAKGFGSGYETIDGGSGSLGYYYKDFGIIFYINKLEKVREIKILKVAYKRTHYKTNKGIRIGSTRSDVKRVYGISNTSKKSLNSWKSAGLSPDSWKDTGIYEYNGISFSFDNDGIVDAIFIYK